MANRRMFSKQITESDAFLEMPLSSQALYFHLWMQADDDWFLWSAKRIIRFISCSDDDFKILVAKRFVLILDWWICVIKHWRINNQIRNDRYKQTAYTLQYNSLLIKENWSYTDNINTWQCLGNQMATSGSPSIDKYSLGEISLEEKILEFISYRASLWKKKTMTEQAIKNFRSMIQKSWLDDKIIIECIDKSIISNWLTIFLPEKPKSKWIKVTESLDDLSNLAY